MYQLIFGVTSSLLKNFSVRQGLGNIGLTSVLHTRSRRRKLHPHLHIIVPYGGYNLKRKEWCKVQKGFLFNKSALAKVWRARVFKAIKNTPIYHCLISRKCEKRRHYAKSSNANMPLL
jgi:hypothetical protein